jgi:hypothetical protein
MTTTNEPRPGSLEEALAEDLLAGLAALREGRPALAVERLRPLVDHPAWAEAQDLEDIHLRAQSLLAQALLDAGATEEASVRLQQLARQARSLRDEEALVACRELQTRLATALKDAREEAARVARRRALADLSESELQAQARTPFELAALRIEGAAGALELGRTAVAERWSRDALALARELGAPREEVLALLHLARAEPGAAAAHLSAAYRRAVEAEEITLVGAVARTAHLLEVPLSAVEGAAHTRLA